MKFPATLLAISLFLCSSSQLLAQSTSEIMASGEGIEVSKTEVEERAKAQLGELELERIRFDAEMAGKEHAAWEGAARSITEEKLLALEADSRGISVDELVRESQSSLQPPTPEEIDQFWEENKARIKGEKEELLPQIERFLTQQRSREVRSALVAELSEKYQIKYHLEPLRFEVAADGFPAKGPSSAPVTVVEFSDFECPYCSRVGPALQKLQDTYGENVRLVYRQFPLTSIHKNAQKAAEASLCARDQQKFWELHDWMFENQKTLSIEALTGAAQELEFDMDTFNHCLASGKYAQSIRDDVRDGMKAGVSGTPAFFVNGRPLKGAVSYEQLSKTVEEELGRN